MFTKYFDQVFYFITDLYIFTVYVLMRALNNIANNSDVL